MAVSDIQQVTEQTFDLSLDGAVYTAKYECVADVGDSQAQVVLGFLENAPFEVDAEFAGTFFSNAHGIRKGKTTEGKCIWEITITFKNLTNEEKEKVETPPLDRLTVWKYKSREIESPLMFDAFSNPVVNAANLPFNPPTTFRTGCNAGAGGIVSAQHNYAFFPPVDTYLWTTNANPFTITYNNTSITYPANALLLTSAEGDEDSWSDATTHYTFFNFNFEFEIDQVNLHMRRILNDGFSCLKAGQPVLDSNGNQVLDGDGNPETTVGVVACTDQFGKPLSEPALLDAQGFQLPIPQPPAVATATYKTFQVYPSVDWTGLTL